MPGETWGRLIGWSLSIILFALFAGVVAAFIWKERKTQRAFFIGLALPYLISGLLTDAQSAISPRRAWPQIPAPPEFLTVCLANLVVHSVTEEGGQLRPVKTVTASVRALEGPSRAYVAGPGPILCFSVEPGRYRLSVSAPGYKDKTVEFEATKELKELTVKLEKSTFLYELLKGAKWAIIPPSETWSK